MSKKIEPPPSDPIPVSVEFKPATGMYFRDEWITGEDNEGNAIEISPIIGQSHLYVRYGKQHFTVDMQAAFRGLVEQLSEQATAKAEG